VAVLVVSAAAAWYGVTGFVASSGRVLGRGRSAVARKAGFTFGLTESDDHNGLLTAQKDNAYRVSTEGSFHTGHWNTVLGDQEIPQSGRSYWEVKIVKKPSDAREFIGVAEPSADVTVPLSKNRKGKGWFWAGDWTESFVYTFMEMKPGMNDRKMADMRKVTGTAVALGLFEEKELEQQIFEPVKNLWTGPGTHIGVMRDTWPPFERGTVVGIDVDMDDGSLAFWADGKFLGIVKDNEDKPVNLKGTKVVPALSVFGRNTGMVKENTVMEIRTGLDAPARPGR